MSDIIVTRERQVRVYECDNQRCGNLCEKSFASDCGWIRFENYAAPRTAQGDPRGGLGRFPPMLWFCTYTCLAAWAYDRACENDEPWCRRGECAA